MGRPNLCLLPSSSPDLHLPADQLAPAALPVSWEVLGWAVESGDIPSNGDRPEDPLLFGDGRLGGPGTPRGHHEHFRGSAGVLRVGFKVTARCHPSDKRPSGLSRPQPVETAAGRLPSSVVLGGRLWPLAVLCARRRGRGLSPPPGGGVAPLRRGRPESHLREPWEAEPSCLSRLALWGPG